MTTTIFVATSHGKGGKWSRYVMPFAIDSFAQLADALYIRNGDVISVVDPDLMSDDVAAAPVAFGGTVQFHWLDFGRPGVTKMLEGFDIVSAGLPSVSIGYDQRDTSVFTTPYAIDADTVPGGIIPLPVTAPSLSVKVDFTAGTAWSLSSLSVVLHDLGNGP